MSRDVSGDVEALYRQIGQRLWRALLLFAGDPEVASDATAEAFAQLLRRGKAVRSPGAWVWRTAFKVAAGELKERRRMSGRVPEMAYEDEQGLVHLIDALRHLSPKQRAALILHHYAGFSIKESAERMGSSASAVGVHLNRATRKLREGLADV